MENPFVVVFLRRAAARLAKMDPAAALCRCPGLLNQETLARCARAEPRIAVVRAAAYFPPDFLAEIREGLQPLPRVEFRRVKRT